MQQQVQELKEKVNQVVEAQKKNILSVFNPAIGLVGETILSYRSQGTKETGSDRPGGFDFFQRSVELNLAASVDPFARGYAVINASADPVTGEATRNGGRGCDPNDLAAVEPDAQGRAVLRRVRPVVVHPRS